MIPVFVMGVCAAAIYERTRMLAAPILVHAIYNATVLGFQWNMMQQRRAMPDEISSSCQRRSIAASKAPTSAKCP